MEQKFYDVLCRAFEKVLGFKVEVILIDPATAKPSKEKQQDVQSRYIENTFETFVVGSSNKFAHAAAQAVAVSRVRWSKA